MVQFQLIDGKKYIVLTEQDYNNIKEVEMNGKKKYIIPQKHDMIDKVDKNEILQMLKNGMPLGEIAGHFNRSVSWLKGKFYMFWGTSCVDKILSQSEN